MKKADILGMTLAELSQAVAAEGLRSYRAGQVFRWLHVFGVSSFDDMTDIPKSERALLSSKFQIFGCKVEKKQVSEYNNTIKYLFRLSDGNFVESVVMKYRYGRTICVSTQIGCKMGCAFCASTMGGFVRSLAAAEILSQVYAAQKDSGARISRVVLMGMGEPLDNFSAVTRFIELISSPDGQNIGMRNISLSTCGIVPKIYELAERKYQLTLSISLHAPNDELRSSIMPINRRYPIGELLLACREYIRATGRRISFEYTMLGGINDSDGCAKELSAVLSGMLCHVNLIPANEFNESPFRRSDAARVSRFCEILLKNGINATVRRSLGSDIGASCGLLRLRGEKEDENA
ncbi:MAG: 23S rRNA (adenine(2503)-C(2))-methyltransferase RlmN [Clostridiales bacterium]|nr:23S rRNA (adenine(2503)-C(2))-methyltransferase RlmN [Clostridiales bacterium]